MHEHVRHRFLFRHLIDVILECGYLSVVHLNPEAQKATSDFRANLHPSTVISSHLIYCVFLGYARNPPIDLVESG